jgi:hypothetical protein
MAKILGYFCNVQKVPTVNDHPIGENSTNLVIPAIIFNLVANVVTSQCIFLQNCCLTSLGLEVPLSDCGEKLFAKPTFF